MNEKNKRAANSRNNNNSSSTQLSLPISEERSTKMIEAKEKDFEEALAELEKVVAKLEGEVKLEEALALFENGMQLSQHCEAFLKTAEQRIEILKRAVNGNLTSEKFNEESMQIGN